MNNPYGGPPQQGQGPGQSPFGAPQGGPPPGQPYGPPPQGPAQPYGPPPQGPAQPYGPPQQGAGQPQPYGQQPQFGPGASSAPGGYAPQSQPYAQPAQPPGRQPGPPGIMLDTGYHPLLFMLAMFKPKVEVDGQELPEAKWGPRHIPAPPGQHQVRVSTKYLWNFGPAETIVHLAPGESAPLYYKAPAFTLFVDGAIGQVPQKTPGMMALLIVSLAPLLICFLAVIIAVIASL